MRISASIVFLGIAIGVGSAGSPRAEEAAKPQAAIRLNRDIRPILAENCYACHGQDARLSKAKLRLDLKDEATRPAKSGSTAIVPGDPGHSEMLARITSDDADEHMPPPETGKTLSPRQIKLLGR